MSSPSEVHAHLPALKRYALFLSRNVDTAEDLVQECLARALAAAGMRRSDDLRVWLFSILHNCFVDQARRRRTATLALAGMDAPASVAPPNQVQAVELREVLEALSDLPTEQRETIVLVTIEGFSYAEAAKVTGVAIGTVMSRLSRAREALRAAVDPPIAERGPASRAHGSGRR